MTQDERKLMQEMSDALIESNKTIKQLINILAQKGGSEDAGKMVTWPSVENNLGLITRASVMISR